MAPPKKGPIYTSRTFSDEPIISPPTIAPGIEEKPPIINTGSAFKARSTSANCTPALAPHKQPATNATTPAADQTSNIICFKGIPIELAAPGSSATALKPNPIFVWVNKIASEITIKAATAPANKSRALIKIPIASAITIIGKSGIPKSNLLTSTPHTACANPSKT